MHAEAITPSLEIPPDALVLEVGGGHRPHRRADVLVDKYLEDIERGGQLVADRPFIQADAAELPFKPKAFDYVICRHVLEHVEAPEAFFHEIGRVGRAGYIETPSAIWEQLHPTRGYHRWRVLQIDGELIMTHKTSAHAYAQFGHLFEALNTHSPEYRMFIRRYADLFFVRHLWHGEIRCCIEPTDDRRRAWFEQPWDTCRVSRFVTPRSSKRQAFDLVAGTLESLWGGLLRRHGKQDPPRERRPVDLAALMQCPVCSRETVDLCEGEAECSACGWHTLVLLPR